MTTTLRSLGRKIFPPSRKAAAWSPAQAEAESVCVVRAFYAVLLALVLLDIPSTKTYFKPEGWDYLWPVVWLDWVPHQAGVGIILMLLVGGSFWAALSVSSPVARSVVFLGVFESVALDNSMGKINHDDHLTVWLCLVLIFFPFGGGRVRRVERLTAMALGQKIILLTYSMSGLGKVMVGLWEAARGLPNSFSPDALPRLVAARLLEGSGSSPLGPWLLDHAWVAWPLMLGVIYLQLFSLAAAFKPSLHKAWGFGLILFHLVAWLLMDLVFKVAPFWLGLFLLLSPFAPQRSCWRAMVSDLPLIGWFLRKRHERIDSRIGHRQRP